VIQIENLTKNFGGVRAVNDVTLAIEKGSITGLIGPNGAGKTTLFNCIAGTISPSSGKILLDGKDVTGLPPHQLFQRGLLRTFQIAHEFGSLTVRDNLCLVAEANSGESLWTACFKPSSIAESEKRLAERANEIIEFLGLERVADELAGNLSGGQKKLLELGRTMMVDAKIVFLDEVGAGVNRTLLNQIGDAIIRLNRERGYTICMIEHDMAFISRLCDPVIVMAEGAVLASGTAEAVKNDEQVISAYLGGGRRARKI